MPMTVKEVADVTNQGPDESTTLRTSPGSWTTPNSRSRDLVKVAARSPVPIGGRDASETRGLEEQAQGVEKPQAHQGKEGFAWDGVIQSASVGCVQQSGPGRDGCNELLWQYQHASSHMRFWMCRCARCAFREE